MANTANVFIASRNRVSGTASNFSVNLQPLITRVSGWALRQVAIDFSWFVINENNNTFNYEESAVALSVDLAIGSPTVTAFCTDLETKLNAATTNGSTYNCTLDANTQKLTITATGASAGTFRYLSGINSSLDYILGFRDADSGRAQTTVADAVQAANSVVHLSGPNVVYLSSSFLNLNSIGNTQFDGDPTSNEKIMRRSNVFAQVPVTVNFGSTVIYTPPELVYYSYGLDNFTNIDIQLLDEQGTELPLNGGEINIHFIVNNFDN
jgi:hypothetical protein